ncbi:MAG TPA: SPOR domain-containing protein [Steroidobacteraceae bacterium]|nr:SPOR domain-containing protein [Steroidobacteraceae bacterium]
MRTFCLALILANALYFVWSQLVVVHVNPLDRAPARTANLPPRLVLAKEVPKAEPPEAPPANPVQPPAVAPAAAGATPETSQAPSTCTSIGPFADLAQASQAQASLRAAGFDPRQRVENGEIWIGYWVSVQNLATRSEADTAIKTLNGNGITDVYLMPGTDPPNVLSLGVFSDYNRAERRAAQVRALGLEPRIDDRKREGSVYWLDVDLKEPGQIIDTSILQSATGRIMRLEMRACPQGA